MKKFLFIIALGAIGFTAKSQAVKISTTGDVGIGTGGSAPAQKLHVVGNSYFTGNLGIGKSNPTEKLHVNGNGIFTGNVGIGRFGSPYKLDVNGEGRFGSVIIGEHVACKSISYPALYGNDLLLGTPNSWAYATFSSYVYCHKLYERVFPDINLCMRPLLTDVSILSVYELAATRGGAVAEPVRYVFNPEELQLVFPQLVHRDTCGGDTMVAINYTGMIPILTAGINEQQAIIVEQQGLIDQQQEAINQHQAQIEILQAITFGQELDLTELYELRDKVEEMQYTINELRDIIFLCCNRSIREQDTNKYNNKGSQIQNEAILYQNTPNPFSSNTEISCYIPTVLTNAFIYVYNLQGIEIKSFPITQGISTVTIFASELPAGMYLYTLVIDGVIVDTKRMILTK